eukprot:762408-Pyramimonas_sp.AAC.1
MEGHELPRDFNHLKGVFIPKGAEASDSEGIYRDPAQSRPLGLKKRGRENHHLGLLLRDVESPARVYWSIAKGVRACSKSWAKHRRARCAIESGFDDRFPPLFSPLPHQFRSWPRFPIGGTQMDLPRP